MILTKTDKEYFHKLNSTRFIKRSSFFQKTAKTLAKSEIEIAEPRLFELGCFEFLVISNSKPYPSDLPSSHLFSVIRTPAISSYFSFPLSVRHSGVDPAMLNSRRKRKKQGSK